MRSEQTLRSRIAAGLDSGVTIRTYHLSTAPTLSQALFAPPPTQEEESTTRESHFLAIASAEDDPSKEVILYGIEILIFASPTLTTIFVSKADSTGFSSKLQTPKTSPSLVASITGTLIDFLLEPRLSTSRVVFSLFARSQNAYLFPGSIENEGKHVLSDRQLIRWWCRISDKVLRAHDGNVASVGNFSAIAHLLVPGCDQAETKAFFPPSSRLDSQTEPKWVNSYPAILQPEVETPPRCLVPRLPDDPKARYLDDLDGDFIDEKGHWRSVKSLDQFWEMMSYRQECSAGRLVGFLWLVFSQVTNVQPVLGTNEVEEPMVESPSRDSALISSPTERSSRERETGRGQQPVPPGSEMIGHPNTPPRGSLTEASPKVILDKHMDRIGHAEHLPRAVQHDPQARAVEFPQTQGEIVLSAGQYQTLMDSLLVSDFAGEAKAAESSHNWVQMAKTLSSASDFGFLVQGKHALAPSMLAEPTSQPINVLTGIRKRKAPKVEDRASSTKDNADNDISGTPVNILPGTLFRKKTKTQEF